MIVQVCASGGLKRESNSLAPGLKLRRNQAALASPALAQTDRQQHPKAGLTGGLLKPDNRHEGRERSAAFSSRLAEPRSTSLPVACDRRVLS